MIDTVNWHAECSYDIREALEREAALAMKQAPKRQAYQRGLPLISIKIVLADIYL